VTSERAPVAFLDESARDGPDGPDGLYVVVAVVLVEVTAAEEVARALVARGQRRLHWRDEGEAKRQAILAALGDLGAPILAAAARPVAPRRAERARARCLVRLAYELSAAAVAEWVLEARQARNNDRDRRTLVGAVRSGAASPRLSYRFAGALDEPSLWLADAAAGAISADLATGRHYRALLAPGQLRLVEVEP
jgi:hypothetical protein